ncbi:MAG TPA: hypothetical protein VJ724_15860 [Tahibacter sp.]|nr:hypothetical protein [Tahibacter sp.]
MANIPTNENGAAAWRTRLFWAWHAWRVRKLDAHEGNGGVAVFNNYAALNHRGYVDPLFDLHRALAERTPGLVPDAQDAFRERLSRELDLRACASVFAKGDGSIGGYAWARVATFGEALDLYQRTSALAHLRGDDWHRLASLQRDMEPVVALGDIGLDVRYRRGFAPLKQLIRPIFELALRHGAHRALWWTPAESPLAAMSAGFGARCVHANATTRFFVLDDIRPLARLFAALPAGEISGLLARVAPKRPPPAPRPTVVNFKIAARPVESSTVVVDGDLAA